MANRYNSYNGAGHAQRDDLNSSREAADTTLDGSVFHSLAVLGKKELEYFVSLILT